MCYFVCGNHSSYSDYANTQESSSSARKRKLSTEADVEGEGENYTEMEEVIVYVTEPDAGGSESPGKAAGIALLIFDK